MAKASLAKRRAARKAYQKAKKKKLGSGARFKAVAASAAANGAENPEAVAAAKGRKKWGAKKMTQLATAARKRKSKKRK